MIIIVDAYNVLKQIKQAEIQHAERLVFIKQLTRYARVKNHTIVVVFDGGACTWPMIEKKPYVTVVYSGSQLSADDYIRRYMKEHAQKVLLLVTNDNELRRNARKYEVDTFDAMDFYKKINPPKSTKKSDHDHAPLIKLAEDTLSEVDDLMADITTITIKADDEVPGDRASSGFTRSKKARKIHKKFKKL